MSRTRTDRKRDFDEFYDNSKTIFEELRDNDETATEYERQYMLSVCPGSRSGGTDKRIVEVLWGYRNYEIETQGRNWKALTETGATLSFYRNDTGHLTISLYPAFSENRKPIETSITIHNWIDPARLKSTRFIKSLWNDFMAYMECTSLDGTPTIIQKFRISYLRNFKNLVIDGKWYPTRFINFSKSVLKFVLTVGLSGFVFFIVAYFTEPKQSKLNNQIDTVINKLDTISRQIEYSTENTEFIKKTNSQLDTLDTRLEKLIKVSSDNNDQEEIEKINLNLNKISRKIDNLKAD